MTQRSCSSMNVSHCTVSAAAGTSARLGLILDTAIIAVSIFVVSLLGLLVILP